VPFKELPLLEVRLPDAVPEAFDMVLNYIYTDRIDPTKKSKCILLPFRISTVWSANIVCMCPACDQMWLIV
jgi:hypothetical protein